MKFIHLFCLFFISSFHCVALTVDEASASQHLQNKISALNAFDSKFNQQVFDSQGDLIQSAEGRVALQQPNKFIWHTHTPDENKLQSDGETIWFYDPFIEQVTAIWLKDALVNNPILLLLDVDAEVWKSYQVTMLSSYAFKIKVLDEKALIDSIQVNFIRDTNTVDKLIIADKQGQFSHYSFTEFNATPTYRADSFIFTVPENADLDDQRQ